MPNGLEFCIFATVACWGIFHFGMFFTDWPWGETVKFGILGIAFVLGAIFIFDGQTFLENRTVTA
jgi:hypothetical protein